MNVALNISHTIPAGSPESVDANTVRNAFDSIRSSFTVVNVINVLIVVVLLVLVLIIVGPGVRLN